MSILQGLLNHFDETPTATTYNPVSAAAFLACRVNNLKQKVGTAAKPLLTIFSFSLSYNLPPPFSLSTNCNVQRSLTRKFKKNNLTTHKKRTVINK